MIWLLVGLATLDIIILNLKCLIHTFVFILVGFTQGNRHLSASQLHLLLHPTEETDDEQLRTSDQIVS